jgi:glucose-1-phosphate thymidylyltransferase
LKIGSPEETAFRMGFIDEKQLVKLATNMGSSTYGEYLRSLVDSVNPTG